MLLSLAYLTSLFYYIPKAALAAVIICAVAPMFDARIVHTLWQVKSMSVNEKYQYFYQNGKIGHPASLKSIDADLELFET